VGKTRWSNLLESAYLREDKINAIQLVEFFIYLNFNRDRNAHIQKHGGCLRRDIEITRTLLYKFVEFNLSSIARLFQERANFLHIVATLTNQPIHVIDHRQSFIDCQFAM